MSERLSAAEWSVIGGLVAREYQNAKRAQLRAGTPVASEKAGVRVEMIGRILLSLSKEQNSENEVDMPDRRICCGVYDGRNSGSNTRIGAKP